MKRGPEAFELIRFAEAAGNAHEILIAAAMAAAAWMWFYHDKASDGIVLVKKALAVCDDNHIPPTFILLSIGLECSDRLGDGIMQDVIIERGLTLTGDPDYAAQSRFLSRYARRLYQKGHLNEAKDIYYRAAKQFADLGDERSRAVTLGEVANILSARGDFEEALRIRRQEELPVYERQGDIRSYAVTTAQIADMLFVRGDLDEALDLYQNEVLPIFERLCDMRSQAITLGKIADVSFAHGKLDEALRIHVERQLPVYERINDAVELAGTFGKIARILFARGELKTALQIHQEQLPIYERIGHVRLRAAAFGDIADILFASGDLDAALRIRLQEELPVYEQLGDVHSRAVTLGNVAAIMFAQGDLDEALRIYREEVLPIFVQLGSVSDYTAALGWVAGILLARREFDEALQICLKEQLPIYEHLRDLVGICQVRLNIAKIRIAQGIYNQNIAQEVLNDITLSSDIAEHIGRVDAIAATGEIFGQVLIWTGATTEAAIVLNRSASAFRKLGREAEAAEIDALIATLPPPLADPTP